MSYPRHVNEDSYTLLNLPGIESALARVEEELRIAVKADEPLLTKLSRHLIDAGGKRIRPSLAIASFALVKQSPATQRLLGWTWFGGALRQGANAPS